MKTLPYKDFRRLAIVGLALVFAPACTGVRTDLLLKNNSGADIMLSTGEGRREMIQPGAKVSILHAVRNDAPFRITLASGSQFAYYPTNLFDVVVQTGQASETFRSMVWELDLRPNGDLVIVPAGNESREGVVLPGREIRSGIGVSP